MSQATVYLIRHGEKPAEGDTLSTQGLERAQGLRQVFGSSSQYNIGMIMAERPKKDGDDQRPLDTITPLAQDLGIQVDTSCKRDDAQGVASVIQNYAGSGNILVCWEHHHLQDIMTAMGVADAPAYPDDRFDLIYNVPPPYSQIASVTSENIPGLDDGHQNP